VDLSASLGDVQPAGHLPKVVVLWGPAVFLLHVSVLTSATLGPHAEMSLHPDIAFVGHSRCSAPSGLLRPPHGLSP